MMVNYMRYVFCPIKGARVVANSTAKKELRCSACGNIHYEAKGLVVNLEPASSKKKKFKKGKKSKSKKSAA